MGGVAQQDMPHEAVAHSFVKVYYQVASQFPHQLSLLYGESSELAHGGTHAVGPDAIRNVANSLPIVGPKPPALFSIDAQVTAGEDIVVVVLGCLGNGKLFSQTFLLERKPVTDAKLIFVCRNDIFRLMPDDPVAAAKTYNPTPISDLRNVGRVTDSEPKVTTGNSTSPQTVVVETPGDGSNQQGTQSVPEKVTSPVAVPIPTTKSSVPVLENQIPANNLQTTPTVVEENVDAAPVDNLRQPVSIVEPSPLRDTAPPPQPPRPKTWASIVSKPSTGAPVLSTPPMSQPVAAASSEKSSTAVDGAVATSQPQPGPNTDSIILNKEEPARRQQKLDGSRKTNAPQYTPRNVSGYQQYGALKSGQRQFGPSAVLQLNSIGDDWNGRHRELAASLREEFGRYGHDVRHVEVKSARGIVFVEYDTIEGVEAAVKAWKEPRSEGQFAGRKLSVTEKRSMRNRPSTAHGAPRGRTQHSMGRGRRGGAGIQHRQPAQSSS